MWSGVPAACKPTLRLKVSSSGSVGLLSYLKLSGVCRGKTNQGLKVLWPKAKDAWRQFLQLRWELKGG